MGNSASSSASRVPLGVSSLVAELGENEVQYEKSMGSSRFLKAVRARHTHGKIVVKTFIKPDPSLTLRHLVRRLRKERETLADVPNVLTYQHVIETDRAGYLIRQWLASSLYDRISTRPFLTTIEKKWITYQLLFAMKTCRERLIPHGDLKTENILVTSSLTCFVTDFAASFKPTYLPLDDPADFAFFFDTSGRRACYVAPERFYAADSETARQKASLRAGGMADPYSEILGLAKRDGKVTEPMDVFSLGCVITELWRDGTPTFTLSQLFKYREGQLDIENVLADISEPAIRDMARSMLELMPERRSTFAQLLATPDCFPLAFSQFLHPYLIDLQRFNPPVRQDVHVQNSAVGPSSQSASSSQGTTVGLSQDLEQGSKGDDPSLVVRRQADHRLDRMYEEWAVVFEYLDGPRSTGDTAPLSPSVQDGKTALESPFEDEVGEDLGLAGEREASEYVLPVQLSIPGLKTGVLSHHHKHVREDGPALIVLSSLLANLRNALRASSKLHALDLLMHLAASSLSDEAKLDRVLPYLVALYDDPSPKVRAGAIKCTVQLLTLVDMITPANESVCSEYVFPNMRRLVSDQSSPVRATYAACFPHLIATAERYIQQCLALQASGALAGEQEGYDDFLDAHADDTDFESQVHDLRAFAKDQVTILLTDTVASVKRSLLANIEPVCRLFGPHATNDVLLSHMITYLNDRDWTLRDAFFQAIVSVAIVGGAGSVEEYIVPLMQQALTDAEEFVTVRVLRGLTRLVQASLLSKTRIHDLALATRGFLCHPNLWIRQAEGAFLQSATQNLDLIDVWTLFYPRFRPLLKAEVLDITASELLIAAKSPLSRNVLQAAMQWASTASKTSFWNTASAEPQSKTKIADGLLREGLTLIAGAKGKDIAKAHMARTDEDDGFMDKLRAQGLGPQDEVKLLALRDYIWRLSRVTGRRYSSLGKSDLPDITSSLASGHGIVEKVDGVTPQTIFFTHNENHKAGNDTPMSPDAQGSVRSVTDSSLPIQLARRRLSSQRIVSDTSVPGSANAARELRLRMASTSSAWGALPHQDKTGHGEAHGTAPPSVASLASPRSVSSSGAAKLSMAKAAPAVAESSANATGTMADLAHRLQSLQMSPAEKLQGRVPQTQSGAADVAPPLFWSTYDGCDPYIQAHLEAVFIKHFRDRSSDLGPRIGAGSSRRRPVRPAAPGGSGPRSSRSGGGASASNRRPEGNLIAYFNEHTKAISAIAVSSDHAYFATASDDGTVKVWDTSRLEKNVTSRSRITYSAHTGRITAILALEGTHCLVSTATDGSLHVWRVDLTVGSLPRYGKPRLVSNFQLSIPGEHVTALMQTSGGSTPIKLILGTSQSRLTVLDLRTMQVLQALRNPVHYGAITCMCSDKDRMWLLCGTAHGIVALWDLRFGLMVKSWMVGSVESGDRPVRVTNCSQHPSKGRGRWVIISYEQLSTTEAAEGRETLLETWDIDRGALVETFECRSGAASTETKRKSSINTTQAILRRSPQTASARTEGLASPAAAIEQLIKLRDSHGSATDQSSPPSGESQLHSGALLGCQVQTFFAGVDGYSSGGLSQQGNGEQDMPNDWIDAGKLVAEAQSETYDRTTANAVTSTARGPAGFIVTGGHDCRIRFWDLGKPERCSTFGSLADHSAGRADFRLEPSAVGAAAVDGSGLKPVTFVHCLPDHERKHAQGFLQGPLRSPLLAQQQAQPAQVYMKAHRDAITALAVIESPFRCVVAADRSGSIKLWE